MLQVDDGLIVGCYDKDFVVYLTKFDNSGKEIKKLKQIMKEQYVASVKKMVM